MNGTGWIVAMCLALFLAVLASRYITRTAREPKSGWAVFKDKPKRKCAVCGDGYSTEPAQDVGICGARACVAWVQQFAETARHKRCPGCAQSHFLRATSIDPLEYECQGCGWKGSTPWRCA